jgi:hypothetical protein
VFGKVLEGMNIVHMIGQLSLSLSAFHELTQAAENFPKGSNDRPLEDVTIVDSGEVSE